MTSLRFEDLDDLGKAGFLIGLTGGLLALVPQLESLLTFQGSWQGPMVLMLLALSMILGTLMATSGSIALGGVTTAVTGLAVAVFGPVAPGIVGVVGGALLYVAADEQRATPQQARPTESREPQRPPLLRS